MVCRSEALSFGVVSFTLVAVALGCGFGPTDPVQRSNAASCTAYVAEMNQRLTACGLLYDPANLCSSANYPGVDMAPFYACLDERTRCDGGALVLDGVESCAPPLWVDAQAPSPALQATHTHDAEEARLRSEEEGPR